jgi:hypothetical protein
MLNIFVDSTTFGQAMGATFDFAIEGKLAEKRLTKQEDAKVMPSVYERTIDAEKILNFSKAGLTQKITNLQKAINAENKRVNSLNILVRELESIQETFAPDEVGIITAYVPAELLSELQSGRVKYYLDDSAETTYYSKLERELWKKALPLIQHFFMNIVFKNVLACQVNKHENAEQAMRVTIYTQMHNMIRTAYREMSAERQTNGTAPAQEEDGLFA